VLLGEKNGKVVDGGERSQFVPAGERKETNSESRGQERCHPKQRGQQDLKGVRIAYKGPLTGGKKSRTGIGKKGVKIEPSPPRSAN